MQHGDRDRRDPRDLRGQFVVEPRQDWRGGEGGARKDDRGGVDGRRTIDGSTESAASATIEAGDASPKAEAGTERGREGRGELGESMRKRRQSTTRTGRGAQGATLGDHPPHEPSVIALECGEFR